MKRAGLVAVLVMLFGIVYLAGFQNGWIAKEDEADDRYIAAQREEMVFIPCGKHGSRTFEFPPSTSDSRPRMVSFVVPRGCDTVLIASHR